ncbi:patatin family protein [Yersinia ruckeri]|uniref:patatin-like phospholipase family protein n=1 Tax=Yersinia ruckeri TaxID=29486 RepID=UPI0020C02792|nr:patatin family protein [Yersinia ruckeri]MCW6538735.1 patatin family protein [Yersinia ruckeri]MCW6555462.1 patatin family protein [Yersinia ruckeri]MCW6636818.1 patatin family protein [Yersinia ruckeri]UZX64800.1 patatin family protein [Yersinia ruckeri]UZX75613.1 patatin family protein [Yersinia ruckeri]
MVGYRIPITLGNIEPLAYKPYQPGKMALVCEGGGQRGIFTAGVLDEFQRARFNPFDLMIGTSAGAQNLSAFVCGQPGYARRVITRYTTNANFFNPLRFVRGGHLIDLDWLITITSEQLPLALDHAEKYLSDGRELLMCACRSDDFTPTYIAPTKENWLPVIKASSAIPGFYRSGVDLDGISYLDGGISDAIPVEEAHRRGADTIVVIRTVPSQMYYTPQWIKRMEHWLSESSLQQMVHIMQQHEHSYHRIQKFIEKPPGKLRIFEIFPPKPLASNALGSRIASLNQDYHLGRRCGRYFLATVGHWLLPKDNQLHEISDVTFSRRWLKARDETLPTISAGPLFTESGKLLPPKQRPMPSGLILPSNIRKKVAKVITQMTASGKVEKSKGEQS